MKILAVVSTAVALAGCATLMETGPSAETSPPTEYPINAPTDRVWSALTEVYTDLAIPIENMDRASGFMRSGDVLISRSFDGRPVSDFFDCGQKYGASKANMFGVLVQMTTLVRDGTSGGSNVRTQVQVHSQEEGRNPCVSLGVMERTLADAIADRVR